MTDLDIIKTGGTFHYNSKELMEAKAKAKALHQKLNTCMDDEREQIIRDGFGSIGESLNLKDPIYFDYGFNIFIGDHVLINYACVFLDEAPITIGDHTMIGPMTAFYTINHDMDPDKRNEGLAHSSPITIGKNVWIGGSVTILPGITIGDNAVIGAGSVVTEDIPSNCVAVGNPAKVIRTIK